MKTLTDLKNFLKEKYNVKPQIINDREFNYLSVYFRNDNDLTEAIHEASRGTGYTFLAYQCSPRLKKHHMIAFVR